MRIKYFLINKYGPIESLASKRLGAFNLFYGFNEEGKTLAIDALLKMILGVSSRLFEGVERVKDMPDGYVVVENKRKNELQLPRDATIISETGISAVECRNIFVIRDSDLSISREKDFFRDVTNRLTGLQTEEIDALIKELLLQGELTLKGDFQDIYPRCLSSRIKSARELIEEIEEKASSFTENGTNESMEIKLWDLEDELYSIEKELDACERIRKKKILEEAREGLENLYQAQEVVARLGALTLKEAQEWHNLLERYKALDSEKQELLKKVEEDKETLIRMQQELEAEQFIMDSLNGDRGIIEEQLEPKVNDYISREEQFITRKTRGVGRVWSLIGPLSFMFLFFSLVNILWAESGEWFYAFFAGSLVLLVAYIRIEISNRKEEKALLEILEDIINMANKLKFSTEIPEEIQERIEIFKRNYDDCQKKVTQLQKDTREQEQKIKTIEQKLDNVNQELDLIKEKIEEIKAKSNAESVETYFAYLEEKEIANQQIEGQRRRLTSLFGVQGNSLEEDLSFWDEEINKLQESICQMPVLQEENKEDIDYSENKIVWLKEKKAEIEKNYRDLWYEIENQKKEIENLGKRAKECLALEDEDVPCQQLNDLYYLQNKLQEFVNHHEKNKEYVEKAISILEHIEEKDEEKVQQLFGSDKMVSYYFKEATGGRYQSVLFDQNRNVVQVTREDGVIFDAWQLSGGTYDQLYLCIRLALGENLLSEEKGFYILDDPFLKSDVQRLENQLRLLQKASQNGWQIIYFTAKEEIKNALQDDIQRGEVNYFPV